MGDDHCSIKLYCNVLLLCSEQSSEESNRTVKLSYHFVILNFDQNFRSCPLILI